ncbi:MAG: argininosuccinate lyase, partial [Planctomycetia bacterium]|nr:argininosuccinate lyase [Planctomycetia bacterium]
ASLELAAAVVAGAKLRHEAIRARLDEGHLDATTLMEYLIRCGMPQRSAHHAVGTLVRTALERGCRLADLSLAEFKAVCPDVDDGVFGVLGPEQAVAAFVSYGSTAPAEVELQVDRWKHRLTQEGCAS